MTTTKFKESAVAPTAVKARKADILLISEGQGSSGMYPAETLKQYGPTAFPAGTQLFYNHTSESEVYDRNGSRDVRDLIGKTTSDARWDEAKRALVAEAEFAEHAAPFVASVIDYVGLSIEAGGYINEDGVVESLSYSPLNSVALVPRAGRGGKVETLYESFTENRSTRDNINTKDPLTEWATNHERGTLVSPEDIAKIVEALKPLFTGLQEALTPAAPEPPAKEETIDVAAVAEAMVDASLPEPARQRVYEAIKNGTEVAEAISTEKSYIDSVLKESVVEDATPGRIQESATGSTGYAVGHGGWVR